MLKLSRSQEREERRAMGRGMRLGIIALFLCWLPVVGLLLSAIGFVRVAKRVTVAHKARRVVYLLLTLLILMVCTGMLAAEAYVYTHDPYLLVDLRDWALDKLTDGGYYSGYFDDTYSDYNAENYYNPGAYTYSDDYTDYPTESGG